MTNGVLISQEPILIDNINVYNSSISAPLISGAGDYKIFNSVLTGSVAGFIDVGASPVHSLIIGNCSAKGFAYSGAPLNVQGDLVISGFLNLNNLPLPGQNGEVPIARASYVSGSFSTYSTSQAFTSTTTFKNGTLYYAYSAAKEDKFPTHKDLIFIVGGGSIFFCFHSFSCHGHC